MQTTKNDDKEPAFAADLPWERDYSFEPRGPVEIAPGVTAHLPIRASVQAGGLTLALDVDLIDGRLVCTRLDVERQGDGPAVTSELIRKFPIGRHVRRIIEANSTVSDPSDPFATLDPPSALMTAGPTDENLRYVARVYRIAEIAGGNPTQAIEALGLNRRTAQRWVQAARDKDILR